MFELVIITQILLITHWLRGFSKPLHFAIRKDVLLMRRVALHIILWHRTNR